MSFMGEYDKNQGYYDGARNEMLPFLPASAQHILDFGCASGNFARDLKNLRPGLRVDGIEVNPALKERAQQHCENVWIGDLDNTLPQLPPGKYDVIFFNDVLEHLVSPDEVLVRVKRALKPGGVVVASIPNMRHHRVLKTLLFKRDFKYEESGVMDRTHLRFFTAKSIRRLFNECEYEILSLQGINATKSLSPVILNLLTLGLFGWDTRFLQFAIIAKPNQNF